MIDEYVKRAQCFIKDYDQYIINKNVHVRKRSLPKVLRVERVIVSQGSAIFSGVKVELQVRVV